MALGPWQIVIVVLLIVLFFGRGRISDMMGDLAKGITSFKRGLREEETDTSASTGSEPPRMVSQSTPTVEATPEPTREENGTS
jgi:sec-independent protein translocase protein TatA